MTFTSLRKNCKWCQAIKADKKLMKRLYASRKYTGKGETLKQIAEDIGLPYHSLPNHCKYHQGLTNDDLATAAVEKLARKSALQLIETNVPTNHVRQSVINQIAEVLTSDDFAALEPEAKLNQLRRFTKDMDDVKAKAKDQDLDILKMMNGARSGFMFEQDKKPTETIVGEFKQFDPWDKEQAEAADER